MPNPRTWTLPADLEAAVSATLREWSEAGQGGAALGARRHPLDGRRRGELARVARDRRRAGRAGGRAPAHRRGRPAGGLHARPAARDGRLEPLPRGPPHDLRGAPRLARALRAGLDGPGPGPGGRGAGRSRADAVRRVLQVGHDPRAEHLQAALLRAGDSRPSAPAGRAIGSSRSRIPARSSSRPPGRTASVTCASGCRRSAGATRRCPTSAWFPRPSWASTSCGCSARPRRWRAPARPGGAPRRIPAPRSAPSWACSGAGGATRSRWSRPRGSTISAPGSNSSWPSRPGSGARA